MKNYKSVYSETFFYSLIKTMTTVELRSTACKCVFTIIYNFFLKQYRAVFLPCRIPVSKADHFLDDKIPFTPSWAAIYLDFINFWVRTLSFFLRHYGRKSYKPVKGFIQDMGKLYAFAGVVYSKNLSTTKRPFYIARPRFFLIHMLDPHLMCIPSLHIMIAVYTYKMFTVFAKQFGDEEKLKDQIDEMKHGAVSICHAVLFVKQHSVNCFPAALYAITCYSPELFPPEEIEAFVKLLFRNVTASGIVPRGCRTHPFASPAIQLPQENIAEIKSYILNMYRFFISEKEKSKSWEEPVLNFLKSMPLKS